MTDAEGPETGDEAQMEDDLDDAGILGRTFRKLGGAAQKPLTAAVRFAVHGYVRDALDEIEQRIDAKLNEIEQRVDRKFDDLDRKMDEWRTREVRHRLRILKYTVIATVIVAAISIVYTLITG